MNPFNFLDRAKRIVTGNGYRTVRDISLREFHLESDGATLTVTLSTNPGFDKFDTNLTSLAWAATKVVEAGITIRIPEDYDSTKDECKLMLKAIMSGSTNTTTAIEAAAYLDSAATTDLAPDNTADLTATAAWVEVDLGSNSFTAGDIVHVVLNPEAHGTDAVHILAVKLEYRTCLVAYSDTNR